MNRIILGNSHSPYFNLALEECLFNEQGDDGVTLYLWQNEHTVVIGRNQNAYRECRTRLLSEEGGNLARRTTGGGAVYHDLGNLNFSFIASKQNYNLKRQLSVIIDAVGSLGINACFTGRNDITTDDGAKFSGNAFLHNRTTSLQHGTLLLDVCMDRLGRYLAPSKEKLASKGVDSVRSRVVNLREKNPDVTVESMTAALISSFKAQYGETEVIRESDLDLSAVYEIEKRNASEAWCYGGTRPYDVVLSHRFSWGDVEIRLSTTGGSPRCTDISSDCMDVEFFEDVKAVFMSLENTCDNYKAELLAINDDRAAEIADWFATVL